MKRKQMQLADSRLVLSSGAKLAHCHGQPVGRLTSSAVSTASAGRSLAAARCRSFIAVSIVSAVRRTSSVSF